MTAARDEQGVERMSERSERIAGYVVSEGSDDVLVLTPTKEPVG